MQVLILDDADTALRAAADATDSLGHDVEGTTDPAEFRDAARRHQPDIQIVDFSLPEMEEQLGLRDGPELVAVDAAEFGHVPTVFLTDFPPDCTERVAELDPRLLYTIVEKPMETSPEAWREPVRRAIAEIQAQPSFGSKSRLGVSTSALEASFYRLSPSDLHALTEDERDEIETDAVLELHEHLLPVWEACDEDWLMLQRLGETIIVTDRGVDDTLPTEDSVRNVEVMRGSGALVLGRPTVLEETGVIDCTPRKHDKDWRRYPFVRLIVAEDERDFHIDTGNPESLISREYLSDNVALPPLRSKRRVVSTPDGVCDVQKQSPVDVDLHVSGPDGNVPVSMRLLAVKDWHQSNLNAACEGQLCPRSADRQCGRRLGLMGRDLLYRFDSGIWQFDPRSGRFYPLC